MELNCKFPALNRQYLVLYFKMPESNVLTL